MAGAVNEERGRLSQSWSKTERASCCYSTGSDLSSEVSESYTLPAPLNDCCLHTERRVIGVSAGHRGGRDRGFCASCWGDTAGSVDHQDVSKVLVESSCVSWTVCMTMQIFMWRCLSRLFGLTGHSN